MSTVDLSVIIVSHNTKALIDAAISSVMTTVKTHSVEVIVVENASTDESATAIKKKFPAVILVNTPSLVGFSAANNLGRKHAHGKYLFFLNPDTEVQPGAVDTLFAEMESHKVKVASGQLLNPDGSIQPHGGALPTLWTIAAWMLFVDDLPLINLLFVPYQQSNREYFTREHDSVGWVGGTALMIESAIFDTVGGWDDAIFLYGEDVELCLRLHTLGLKIGLFPEAKILHRRQGSVGTSSRSYIGEFEGLLYIWKKHFPAWQLPVLRFLLIIGAWLRVVFFGILLGDEHRKATYLDAAQRARMA
jgi:N-acetylglucosaminyl-diphospho-decaprenol L-rhamnosyltransferase